MLMQGKHAVKDEFFFSTMSFLQVDFIVFSNSYCIRVYLYSLDVFRLALYTLTHQYDEHCTALKFLAEICYVLLK